MLYLLLLGEIAFYFFETFGFPLEQFLEEIKNEFIHDPQEVRKSFEKSFKKHQEVSRAGAEKKFGGIGKEAGYEAIKLHTATHLLHQALRDVLGDSVKQTGSDITHERLRFDFSYLEKMSKDEIKKVEKVVNQKIKENLKVEKKEMNYSDAIKSGALAFFKEKYPDRVTIYSIDKFSKEICAGPHVKKTGELGS